MAAVAVGFASPKNFRFKAGTGGIRLISKKTKNREVSSILKKEETVANKTVWKKDRSKGSVPEEFDCRRFW